MVFIDSHTGEHIKKALQTVLKEFGLEAKTVVFITDQGSNIVKACRLIGSERYGCIAHGLHNLIAVEGVQKGPDVQTIICKAKDIIKTFTFKSSLLEGEAKVMVNEQKVAELQDLLEKTDLDEQISMSCEDDLQEDEELVHVHQDPDNQMVSSPDEASSSNATSHAAAVRGQMLTSLKKDCSTRWNCVLAMLESLVTNQQLVERCLTSLRLFDKLLSDGEWDTIINLVQFLKAFKTASEVLSGSKYPTMSLIMLFRSEVVAALAVLPTDCDLVKGMKHRMSNALNHRLPVTELNVVAALLDPSQRNLASLQEFLLAHKTTAVELISGALDKYVGNNDAQQEESNQAAGGRIGPSADSGEISPAP